jgi:heme o synthase
MSVIVGVEAISRRSAYAVARDYLALTKPRVIVLLEVTALAAMIMAARGWPGWNLVIATLTGGWLAASGANAINCWFDRDIDASMGRTRSRPLPSGRLDPRNALGFGVLLAAVSFALLVLTVNLLAACLALAALLFYVTVYTMWLKRSSMQNIVIGGAAGAIPPLVGWAAVQGSLDVTAVFLFAVIFYWTPPHFWALSLLVRGDYQRARVPMLPVVAGEKETRRQILLYALILCVVTVLPVLTRSFGAVYAAGALALDAALLVTAARVVRDPSSRSARRLFYFSMAYLALLFTVMALDRVVLGAGNGGIT